MSFDNAPTNYGIMARVSTSEGSVAERRLALARRHLRSALTRHPEHGHTYSEGNISSLYEILLKVIVRKPTPGGWDPEQAKLCCKILNDVDKLLSARGLEIFTERQVNNYACGITQAQFDALAEAIAGSAGDIEVFTHRERWMHICDKKDDYLARDATIGHLMWEAAAGMHSLPPTELTITCVSPLPVKEQATVVANLDTVLCLSQHTAAVEQTLMDSETGLYTYVPNANGSYKVRVFQPDDVEAAVEIIREHGFSVGERRTLPLSPAQQEREQRHARAA